MLCLGLSVSKYTKATLRLRKILTKGQILSFLNFFVLWRACKKVMFGTTLPFSREQKVFIFNLLKYEIYSILKVKRHSHEWTSILKSSLFWVFRQRRLAVCYQPSGTNYPLKINLKTVVDNDNDDNDDTKKLCPRKRLSATF